MRSSCSILARCCALAATLVLCTDAFGERQARRFAPKARQTVVDPARHHADVIIVKFTDELPVGVSNAQIADGGTGALDVARGVLARLPGLMWEPIHKLPEARLDELRANAQASLQRDIADLTTFFYVKVPPNSDAGVVCDALNTLDVVENAWPAPLPAPPPVAPDFEGQQGYLDPRTAGVDADCMWLVPGGTGGNIAIADLEYSWNLSHLDFPTITLLGPPPTDPFGDDNHGTAVLGEMAGLRDGMGVTGITYDSTFYVAAASTGGNYDLAGAITTVLGTLGEGDLMLIEQQTRGPNYLDDGTQFGLVASEWDLPVYAAILVAVGNGITVVEAAGNGSQDLDAPEYNVGHAPFTPAGDSGAIIVGAGAPPGHPDGDRSRLSFSNYGSTVDLQGIGTWVVTTGYGDLYNAEGANLFYTASFGGTSSSSPIVTGAAALLQSAFHEATGLWLSPMLVRDNLIATGSPQLDGTNPASEHIGPRPDAASAFAITVTAMDCDGNFVPDPCDPDCNGNGVPDDCDIDPSDPDGDGIVIPDCNGNGVPDDCDIDPSDPDGDGLVSPDCQPNGVPDECDFAAGTSLDCNGNGIPDECDIADGTSLDCQPNGTPDECEIWHETMAPGGPFFCTSNCDPDCNYNGIPDECDIADGTSQDCNGNMIPDECDVAVQLWTVSPDDNILRLVDYETLATLREVPLTHPAETIFGCDGLAWDADNRALLVIFRNQAVPGTGDCAYPRLLGRVDTQTGVVTIIGNTGECLTDITWGDGALFGMTDESSGAMPEWFFEVSTSDASLTPLLQLPNGGPGDAIGWYPPTAEFYHASGEGAMVNDPPDGLIFEKLNLLGFVVSPLILDDDPSVNSLGCRIEALAYDPFNDGLLAGGCTRLFHRTAAGFETFPGLLDHDPGGLAFTTPVSLDCNQNLVPDECEIAAGAPDCNNNGRLDECEIASEYDPLAAAGRDYCQHAEYVCPGIPYSSDTFSATSEYFDFPGGTIDGLFWCGPYLGVYDYWYKYRPSANGVLFVHVEDPNGVGLEWVFGIYDGCPVGPESLLDCNVFQHHGTIVLEVEQGRDYFIRIAARDFGVGRFDMNLVGPACVLNGNDLNANGMLDDCECPWDVTNDGTVDWDDFMQVVGRIGQACAGCAEDIDHDGDVDSTDAQSVFLHFGDCPENIVCTPAGGNPQLCASGLPADCYCFTRHDGLGGLCVQDFDCGAAMPCPAGDCPPGFVCVTDTACGINVCAPLVGCSGNADGAPGLAILGGGGEAPGLKASGRYVKDD